MTDESKTLAGDLTSFRDMFPALRTRAYLFSGAMAPAATPVRRAWDTWTEAWSGDPNSVMTEEAMLGEMAALRQAFAGLIGASASEIALTDNTSRAANIAIRLLAARSGGHVVVDDTSYPSSVYPWYAIGRKVRYLPTDRMDDPSAAVAEAIDADTLAVCVSHVAPQSGRRHDLGVLSQAAHEQGAALMVDAAQTAGVVPLDVMAQGVDVLVTTSMKWLLGPPGIGYLYVNQELLGSAPVLDVGYIGLDVALGDWPAASLPPVTPHARRYELGLPALPGLTAARAGIELLSSVGLDSIYDRAGHLAGQCIDGLLELGQHVVTPQDPAKRAAVLVFLHDQSQAIFAACRERGVDVGTLGPKGGIRVDPHGFNNEEDIDRFLLCCRQFARGGRAGTRPAG